jgi:hypothetical protein
MRKICKNCMDFDSDKNVCTIRFLIQKGKPKGPLPRKHNEKGCEVFMEK